MLDLQEFQKLKTLAEKTKSEISRAEGALDQIIEKIKTEFDCSTIEEAETLLKKLEEEEKEALERYDTALAEFKQRWGDLIDASN